MLIFQQSYGLYEVREKTRFNNRKLSRNQPTYLSWAYLSFSFQVQILYCLHVVHHRFDSALQCLYT